MLRDTANKFAMKEVAVMISNYICMYKPNEIRNTKI